MNLKQLIKQGVEVSDKVLLKVSRDGLEAVIVSKDRTPLVLDGLDIPAIMAKIREEGITVGLLASPVAKREGMFCVAKGQPAEQGENAKVRYYVKPVVVRSPKFKGPNKQMVDFRELGAIVNVSKGKLLLEKVALTQGTPGKTVTGDIINAKPGKDLTIKVGAGVVLAEDGQQAFSEIEGKYMLVDGKASVMSEHTLLADVDLSIGNVSFVGQRLNINGAVLPGFKIKCKGDIFVAKGVQDSARIIAGGNVDIRGGVVGAGVVIKCWGNAVVDFVENVGQIEVKGDVTITDSIIQGHARVGGSMRVLSGKGTLIGGKYTVGGSLHVLELGSDAEVITLISVGINPVLEEAAAQLANDKEIWPEKMSEILKATMTLKKMQRDDDGNLIPEKVALLKEYNDMLPEVMEKISDITEREQKLDEEMEQSANEAVYVYGTVFPGVTVTIAGVSRVLGTEEQGVVIHFDKGKRLIHCRAMTPEERQVGEG